MVINVKYRLRCLRRLTAAAATRWPATWSCAATRSCTLTSGSTASSPCEHQPEVNCLYCQYCRVRPGHNPKDLDVPRILYVKKNDSVLFTWARAWCGRHPAPAAALSHLEVGDVTWARAWCGRGWCGARRGTRSAARAAPGAPPSAAAPAQPAPAAAVPSRDQREACTPPRPRPQTRARRGSSYGNLQHQATFLMNRRRKYETHFYHFVYYASSALDWQNHWN